MPSDAYIDTLDAGLRPDVRRRAAMETVRRILLEAEEVYPSDPDLTLGAWAARVQETIAVAADLTLAGGANGHSPTEDGVAFDVIAVFAEVCAESIRAASRVAPGPPINPDPKEALLARVASGETALESHLDWHGLQRVLVRCQAAMEPVSSGLREGDLPMNRGADPSGVAYDALAAVAALGYDVVYALCAEVRPGGGPSVVGAEGSSATQPIRSVGTPGASVRRTERRLYVKAGLRVAVAVALLGAAIAVVTRGASSSAILLAIGGGFSLISAWRIASRARSFALGAAAEEEVGRLLDRLGVPWLVEHDVPKDGGGNIDHILHSPAGIYLIDTKRSRYRDKDFDQARRHAAWAHRQFGGSRTISVICLQRSDLAPELVQGVWIVGAGQLQSFLLRAR